MKIEKNMKPPPSSFFGVVYAMSPKTPTCLLAAEKRAMPNCHAAALQAAIQLLKPRVELLWRIHMESEQENHLKQTFIFGFQVNFPRVCKSSSKLIAKYPMN